MIFSNNVTHFILKGVEVKSNKTIRTSSKQRLETH